jgi:hypothetical protein
MCVCVCVCVCVYVYIHICTCIHIYIHIHTHIHTHTQIYIYRQRESARARGKLKDIYMKKPRSKTSRQASNASCKEPSASAWTCVLLSVLASTDADALTRQELSTLEHSAAAAGAQGAAGGASATKNWAELRVRSA